MFSNNIMPSQGKLIIPDLIPATWYDLLMVANSEPGTTEAQYLFSTLTITGGKTIFSPFLFSSFCVDLNCVFNFFLFLYLVSYSFNQQINPGTIPPITSNTYSNWELNLGDPVVLAPILCAFIVFIVIFITIAILMSTKHQRTDSSQETCEFNCSGILSSSLSLSSNKTTTTTSHGLLAEKEIHLSFL